MVVISGFVLPTNKIVIYGEPKRIEKTAEEAGIVAGMYVSPGSSEGTCVRGQPGKGASGFCSYEASYHGTESATDYYGDMRPRGLRQAFGDGAYIATLIGGGFGLAVPVTPGVEIPENAPLAGYTNGTLLPGLISPGQNGLTIRIPFTKSTTEVATPFTIPANVTVLDARVVVETNVAASTIDIGILSTEVGGDADGFLDGVSCATAGTIRPIGSGGTTLGAITKGALISDIVKSGDTTAKFYTIDKPFVGDGVAKTVSYTTSDHAIAGFIELDIGGVEIIGKTEFVLPADDAQQWVVCRSYI